MNQTPDEHNAPDHASAAFFEFVTAQTWSAARAVIDAHPELLTEDSDDGIEVLTTVASKQGPEVARVFSGHRRLLSRCRMIGVEAAFAEAGYQLGLPPEIEEPALRASNANAGEAVAAAQVLLDHPLLGSLPGAQQAALQGIVGSAFFRGYQALGFPGYLDAAILAWQESLTMTPPDSPDRARRLDNLATGLTQTYRLHGDATALDTAVALRDQAVALTPLDHPDRPGHLSNRATTLSERHSRTGSEADLAEALASVTEALELTLPDSAERRVYLSNRGTWLGDRYKRLGSAADLDAAVADIDEALSLTPTDDPGRPVVLTNRGNRLMDLYERTGDPAQLEAALAAKEEAIQLTPAGSPDRAGRLTNRTSSLFARYDRMGNPDDLDQILATADEALKLTTVGSPQRPTFLNTRAYALIRQYDRKGDPELLDAAITAWDEAIALLPRDSPERPGYLNNRANGLSDRFAGRGDRADLDLALADSDEAVSLTPEGIARPVFLSSRSNKLVARYQLSGARSDLESAIADVDESVRMTPPSSPSVPSYLGNRANLLSYRYAHTGDVRDLDAAVVDIEAAVTLTSPGSPELPGRLANRAHLRWDRYEHSGTIAELDAAVADLAQALTLTPSDSADRPHRLADHATGVARRYARTRNVADLETALHAMDESLALTPSADTARPARLHNRANVLAALYDRTSNASYLHSACDSMVEAVAVTSKNSPELPALLNNLSNLLSTRYSATHESVDLEKALSLINEALALAPPGSPMRPAYLHTRATRLAERHAVTGDMGDLDAGVAGFREVGNTAAQAYPETAILAALAWSGWAIERGAWGEVTEAGSLGLTAADQLLGLQAARGHKESRLRDVRGLAIRTAYAWAKLGMGPEAVIAAERGRAVLLAEALDMRAALDRLQGAGHGDLVDTYTWAAGRVADASAHLAEVEPDEGRDWGKALSDAREDFGQAVRAIEGLEGFEGLPRRQSDGEVFAEVVANAETSPITYVMAARPGGMALTVEAGGGVTLTELPDLAEADLAGKVSSYVQAFPGRADGDPDQPEWLSILDEMARWLGVAVARPLFSALAAAGIGQVILVPMGPLGYVPLHAAWIEDDSNANGRCYALDSIRISYAPNARSLGRKTDALLDGTLSMLAIDEPWPVEAADLRGSTREVEAAVASFGGNATVLRHRHATRQAVLGAIPDHTFVHLSCHGRADVGNPLESSLLMSDGPLTLREILVRRVDRTQLVVLSACETAFAGTDLPDEAVSLSTGLIQAGAAAAIGTLWPVDDLATMVLLTRFYHLWRGDGLPIPEALRQAQRWTRDLTEAERQVTFPGVDFGINSSSSEHPYAHPYWWAAFTFTGC